MPYNGIHDVYGYLLVKECITTETYIKGLEVRSLGVYLVFQ